MKEIKIFDINDEVRSVSVETLAGLSKSEDGKGLACKLSDGTVGTIPFVAEGKRNPDIDVLLDYVRNKNKEKEEAPVVEEKKVTEKELETPMDAEYEEVPEEVAEEHEDFVPVAENGKVDENLRKKAEEKEFKEKQNFVAKHWKKVALAALATGLLVCAFHSCSNQDIKTDVDNQVTLESMASDSVYTEMTEESVVTTAYNFQNALKETGVEISGEDALAFVTLTNIEHIKTTNPELLEKLFIKLEVSDPVTLIQGVANRVINPIVTSEITADDKNAGYWTMAIMDPEDKKIADDGMALIADCKEIVAKNKAGEIGYEDATLQIKMLIEENFVVPNFDKSVAYTIEGEDGQIYYSKDIQTAGANFMTDAIITGILMGDQDLKDHVNAPGYISVTSKDGQRYDIMSYVSHMSENSSSEIKDDTVTPNEATTGDVIEEENKYSFALTQYDPAVYADIIKEYQQEYSGFEPTYSELTDQLKVISANEANVHSLHALINGCVENLQNTQEGPVKTR